MANRSVSAPVGARMRDGATWNSLRSFLESAPMRPANRWLEVDETRRGRICLQCGWVRLPRTPVVRHTVASLIPRLLPDSPRSPR